MEPRQQDVESAFIHPVDGSTLIPILEACLPQSVPLYRRLQHELRTPASTVIATFPPPTATSATDFSHVPNCFAAAYVDMTRAPEVQMQVFVSGEVDGRCNCKSELSKFGIDLSDSKAGHDWNKYPPAKESVLTTPCAKALMSVIKSAVASGNQQSDVAQSQNDFNQASPLGKVQKDRFKIGSIAAFPLAILRLSGLIDMGYAGCVPYMKFIFRASQTNDITLPEKIPVPSSSQKDGSDKPDTAHDGEKQTTTPYWAPMTDEHLAVVISRTDIPRKVSTLRRMQSACIFVNPDHSSTVSEDRIPISWAFAGLDGSLSSLHVEPEYRGLGLAKAVAAKLFRHIASEGGTDWNQSNVAFGNVASEGVCRSLRGVEGWSVWWVLVDATKVGA